MKKNFSSFAEDFDSPLPDLNFNSMTYHASYILRRAKAKGNGLTPLYLRIIYNQERVEISLNTYVHPKQWDGSKHKGNSNEAKTVNKIVETYKFRLHQIFIELTERNAPITASILKNKLTGREKAALPERKITLADAYHAHVKELAQLIELGNLTNDTLKKYEYLFNHLKNFLFLEHQQEDIPLEKVDLFFLRNFHYYLLSAKSFTNSRGQLILKKKSGANSAAKNMHRLKTMINMAISVGWISINPFVGFKAKTEKVEQDYLTEDEINSILTKQIENERLQTIKDLFLFQCFTGLSYVDMEKITKSSLIIEIDGDKWLHISRQKTGAECKIPLLWLAEKIIKKYSQHPLCNYTGKLLPVISNQKYNVYLKELATICNIKKRLTTHVGRRAFASLALNNGVPAETLIKLIGHSNFRHLHLYAKHDDKKINNDIQQLKQKFG